jgi:tetratricopeptide (TPR) repeat protein
MSLGQFLLGGNVSWRFGTVATSCIGVLVVALLWAFFNRGALRILPFDGPDGAALSLKFGQALDAVAGGAQEGIHLDATLRRASATALPAISIPGINLSLTTVVGFFQEGRLSETRIQGAVVPEGPADAKTYRVWLQVDGPNMPTRVIRTEPAASVDDAFTAAAPAAYEILRPVVAAFYLYRRAPNRSLQIVEALLRDPDAAPEDKAAAYRIWGLVLRDASDYDAARQRFRRAAELTDDDELRARIRVDEGYVDLWMGASREAASVFEQAAGDDRRWATPLILWGDALYQSHDFASAAPHYHAAIELDPEAAQPWLGLARVQTAQLDYAAAIDSYAKARALSLDESARFAIACEFGDLLLALGCLDGAALEYDRAMRSTPALGATRPDWQQRLACEPANTDLAQACSAAASTG